MAGNLVFSRFSWPLLGAHVDFTILLRDVIPSGVAFATAIGLRTLRHCDEF